MNEKYCMICKNCGLKITDDTFNNYCTNCHKKGLLYTEYSRPIKINTTSSNLYRYMDWLPVNREFHNLRSIAGCYKSKKLAEELNLSNLWILFSGYWPEKGAFLESLSFKEFEAIGVLSRVTERTNKIMILSSAGNTGLSAIFISQKLGIPVIVAAPEYACVNFKTTIDDNNAPVFLISLKQAVYNDCISFVSKLVELVPEIIDEGGVYNIARRDFLGLPILHAGSIMKEIPDHYFQAVGSGTGAIAAWETSIRLSGMENYTDKSMCLHLAQNKPFTPVVNAWEKRKRDYKFKADHTTRKQAEKVLSHVLTNPFPAYSIKGGLFDALSDTNGNTYGVTNNEIKAAKLIFENLEGIDIQYPSAVCVAALKQAIENGNVSREDSILLHITGGGKLHLEKQKTLYPFKPSLTVKKNELDIAVQGISRFLKSIKK